MRGKYSGFRSVLVILAIFIIISGCDKELTELEEQKILNKLSPQELELIQATNSLSLNIIKSEYQQKNNENFIFSPISVGMALGMVYNGVGEKEKLQIQHVTGLESLVEKEINKSYNEIITFLQLNYDPSDIFCANSLWFSYGIDINENYRTKIMAYYDAEISEISFGKKTALQYINNWGNLKSGGQLSQLTKLTPPSHYNIYFVNAFGVNASWKDGRYFTKPAEFTNLQGEISEINSIHLDQTDVTISQANDFEFIDIPLHKQNLLFSIVNPAEGTDLEELIVNFEYDELLHQVTDLQNMKANISLPHISFESENNLKSTLGNMGLQNIFQPSSDFTPSFTSDNHGISEINQVAQFNIMGQSHGNTRDFTNPELKLININRPFLYFVRDKHTKSVIFAGYYLNPEE